MLADLGGKGRRIRTVAVPLWVKQGINAWMAAAKIEEERLPATLQRQPQPLSLPSRRTQRSIPPGNGSRRSRVGAPVFGPWKDNEDGSFTRLSQIPAG